MATHDFGIMDKIKYKERYDTYEPNKYNCIFVNDDLIEKIIYKYLEDFRKMRTYEHTTSIPMFGLNYIGVTLIPPISLPQFKDIITKANTTYNSRELEALISLIAKAHRENKYLIHYGI